MNDVKVILVMATPIAISLITFLYTVYKKANEDYVSGLEKRIVFLESEFKQCCVDRDRLQSQNYDLLTRLYQSSAAKQAQ